MLLPRFTRRKPRVHGVTTTFFTSGSQQEAYNRCIQDNVTRMATKQPKYETLRDLLVLKLGSLLDIEEQLIKALPKMARAAQEEKLREAFTSHLEETKEQAKRLQEAFDNLSVTAKKTKVEAIRGLVKDTEWIIKSLKNPAARDALLIASAQYVEHYEMAGYGTAHDWAQRLGENEVADLLQETLDEEKAADTKLNDLATSAINDNVDAGTEE